MRRRHRRAIEAGLAPRYRGVAGYRRLLDDVPIRISVTGTRGKSSFTSMLDRELRDRGLRTYAKITGLDPTSIVDGTHHPIERAPRPGALLDETRWEIKRWFSGGLDAIVAENQGTSEYTMRVFNHRYVAPTHLVVLNVRRDHLSDLGVRLERHARAFVRAGPKGVVVVSGERDPGLREVLAEETERLGGRFVDPLTDPVWEPNPPQGTPPGFESPVIVDALLGELGFPTLGELRLRREWLRLEGTYAWHPSRLAGVEWFDGAGLNDVDSTQMVLGWLQRQRPRPVAVVAYFRGDRPDRTATFVPWLRDRFDAGDIRHAYLAGPRADTVARRLGSNPVTVLPDEVDAIPRVLWRLERECAGGAVFTVANAVPAWARALAAGLRTEHGQRRGEHTLPAAEPTGRDRIEVRAPEHVVRRPSTRAGLHILVAPGMEGRVSTRPPRAVRPASGPAGRSPEEIRARAVVAPAWSRLTGELLEVIDLTEPVLELAG